MLKTALGMAVALAALAAPTAASAIVNGTPVPATSAPWIVELSSGAIICTGTLVAPGVVLTDAHCVTADGTQPADPASVSVNFPSVTSTIGTDGEFIPQQVAQIAIAPGYNPSTIANDVALVQLDENEYSRIYAPTVYAQPTVALATSPQASALYAPGTPATVAGWGATSGNAGVVGGLNPSLQEASLDVQAEQDCQDYATASGWSLTLDPAIQFCAQGSSSAPAAICQGDSGGPLFETVEGTPTEVGLSDFGTAGCPAATPSYFTSVLGESSWLNAEIPALAWTNPSVSAPITSPPVTSTAPQPTTPAKLPLVAAVTRACQRIRAPRHAAHTACVRVGHNQVVRLSRYVQSLTLTGTTAAARLQLKATGSRRSIGVNVRRGHWTATLPPRNGWLLTAAGTNLEFVAAAWDAP